MDKKRYTGVLVKCGDKVLLCKRNNLGSFPGMWSIPGGKLEEGESTRHGAKREFFEETAVDIDKRDISFIGVIPRHTRDGMKVKGFMYVYLLETEEPINPDLANAIDGEEHTECKYFSKDELDESSMGHYLYELANHILQKKFENN